MEHKTVEYNKNDIVQVTIEDISTEGDGIGKIDGFTLFIKDAVVGDVVEAKILKNKKSYAYARLEKVIEPSPFRVSPKCEYHRQCGGCQLQILSYKKQLEFKEQKIRNNLIRIGGFAPEFIDKVMEPIVGMEIPFRYRNKAQYPVGCNQKGEIITGFYAGRTHSIIANTECFLGVEENKDILEIIIAYMNENKIKAYDEMTGQGFVRHVLIRKGFTSGEIMVCLVVNKKTKKLPNQEAFLEKLSKIAGMTSVSLSINTEKTNVIMGKEIVPLWGEPTISDTIHVRNMKEQGYPFTGDELVFKISPLSFYQVNPVQTEKLYSLALEYAALTGNETVWDLYCGIGTISLFMAQKAGQVCGVEIIPQAIDDARENAKRNHLENATFFVGKAEEVLPKFYEDAMKKGGEEKFLHPDVIVVDPPRKGCDEACLDTMVKMQPDRIVYVSCDVATLARDLKILCEKGYEIQKVRGVDQFANTVHVETVVLLSKGMVDKDKFRKVKVDFSLEDMDLTELCGKATYAQIHDYVLEQTGLNVSRLYIAQIKKKCGFEVGENHNLPKSEDARQPKCPPEKEKAIMQAFRYYGII